MFCEWLLAAGVGSTLLIYAGLHRSGPAKPEQVKNPMSHYDKTFVADILPFSVDLDPAVVRSAGNYIAVSQLVRPLLKQNTDTQMEGDLAQKWEISSDFKTYRFFLDPDAHFSNGEPITAEDLRATLERTRRIGHAVHFDFNKIQSLSAEGNVLTIQFGSAQPDFLTHAHHPEFSVLHKSDYERASGDLSLTVTSGAYSLLDRSQMSAHSLHLKKNPYFKGFAAEAPEDVLLQSKSDAEKAAGLAAGTIGFAMPSGVFSPADVERLDTAKTVRLKPHIGFTYWVTLNPNRLRSKEQRHTIQAVLNSQGLDFSSINDSWEPANQLYLPLGPSRLKPEEADQIWSEIRTSAKDSALTHELRFLVSDHFVLKDQLVKKLEQAGIRVQVTTYDGQDKFAEYVVNGINEFDLIQTNNDFSSADLIENMTVTLNPNRPLIVLGQERESRQIAELFHAAQNSGSKDRQEALGKIGEELLTSGLVAPIAYYHLYFYQAPSVDASGWSTLYPEVSFWKLKVQR